MACPRLLTALILATAFPVDGALAQMPPAIAAPGEDIVATFHAEGAQIYQCKPGNEGKLAWVFREPIATLLLDDKTVGRHYAGPTWEHGDGSVVRIIRGITSEVRTAWADFGHCRRPQLRGFDKFPCIFPC
jgi:hypothetical protein